MKRVVFVMLGLATVLSLLMASVSCGWPGAAPSIQSDKPDYQPEEIVTIIGAGFSPGPVDLTVTRPDGEIDEIPDVSADDSGAFTATYQLDGITGTYTVTATDGTNEASTTFTDSALPAITLNPTSGAVGTTVTVDGEKFQNNDNITVTFDGSAVATALVSGNKFSCTFVVPSTSDGPKIVVATSFEHPIDSASADFEVTSGGCPDADGDGVCDGDDICPGGDDNVDTDGDGVPNHCDICEGGDDNVDTDADGVPNYCDICEGGDDNVDTDGDGVPNYCDICGSGDDTTDTDGDGVPDACDICEGGDDNVDTDGDGVPNYCDVCGSGDDSVDTDADGVPDACDICPAGDDNVDIDADGVPDACDCCVDADGDGYGDGTCCIDSDPNDSDPLVPGRGAESIVVSPQKTWYVLRTSSTEGGVVTKPRWGMPYLGYYRYAYYAGEVVVLEATPDAGYHFVDWTGDVDTVDDVNAASTTIVMDGFYEITANFEAT